MVPVSSAHWVTGRTTSASAAVSDSTMSATTSRSSDSSRSATWLALGAETTMLLPKTSSARGPAVGAERLQQLVRRAALPGQRLRGHAPHAGDVLASRRVVDHPVARELVGLLPVLTPALPVALAGQAAVSPVRRPALPERERQVDPREHRVRALGVLLGAARRSAPSPCPRRRAAAASATTSVAGTPVTRSTRSGHQAATERRTSSKPGGARGDVLLVDVAVRRPARAARPSASARSVPGTRLDVHVGPRPRSACGAGRSRPPCRRVRAARRGAARRAAWSRRGSTRPARARRSARCRRAGTAARGRRRRPGCRPAAADDMQKRPL